MLRTRVIPCLLLRNTGLVKTIKFKDPTYIGDPINAVKIFNDKEVDELIFLDITASKEGNAPNIELLHDIASECFMPLCYGGGVTTIAQMKKIYSAGVEKIALNYSALHNEALVREASDIFGASSVVGAIDVKKTLLGKLRVYDHTTKKCTKHDPIAFAKHLAQIGVGEILINSVDRDGTMDGYDIDIIKAIAAAVTVPVIASGGAGSVADLGNAAQAGASGVAAGSFFVFQGKHRAVLINVPTPQELKAVLPHY